MDRYTHNTGKYKDLQIIYIPQTNISTQHFKYLFSPKRSLPPDHNLTDCLVEVGYGSARVSTVL